MANLRREPGAFFFFWLVAFTMTLSMSMFFRLFASMTKTIAQALAPSSIILLFLVMYTGFVIPVQYMKGCVLTYHNSISVGAVANTEFAAGLVGFGGSIQLLTGLRA